MGMGSCAGRAARAAAKGLVIAAKAASPMASIAGRVDAWDAMGRLLLRWGRPRWAGCCYRRATALDGRSSRCWRNRAVAAARSGSLVEAALCYRTLLRLEPQAPRAYLRLAHVYERTGAVGAAIEVCCQGLRNHPGAPPLHRRLARLLLRRETVATATSDQAEAPLPCRVPAHGNPLVSCDGPGECKPACTAMLTRDVDAYLGWLLASHGEAVNTSAPTVEAGEAAAASRPDVS